ncbi:hypothetical protein J6590_104061 [Homalodisca vitripennis]|nr:hypothetical protein J6590_104061 [Homalodisca vitripennis]
MGEMAFRSWYAILLGGVGVSCSCGLLYSTICMNVPMIWGQGRIERGRSGGLSPSLKRTRNEKCNKGEFITPLTLPHLNTRMKH